MLTDVDGNTFIDFTGGVGCLNVGHAHPKVVAGRAGAGSSASRTPTSRSSRTRSTSRSPSASLALAPFSGPGQARRSSTRAPRPSRTRSSSPRAYTKRPAVIAFEGAFHGRTLMSHDAHLEDAPVQGGPRAVRARGLPRPVRERLPRARPTDALAALERAFVTQVARRARRGDRRRAGAGRGRLHPRAEGVPPGPARDLRRARDRPRRRRGADRLRPHRHDVRDRAATASSPT